MMMAEARRRRDEKGRFMEGGQENEMNARNNTGGQGNEMNGYPNMRGGNGVSMGGYSHHPGWTPPYYDGGEMRQRDNGNNSRRGNRQGENSRRRNADDGDQRRMGGYGGFVWDRMPPVWPRAGGDEEEDDEEDDKVMHGDNITDMRQYQQNHHGETQRKIGFGEEMDKQHLTRKEAEEWVSMMEIPGDRPGEMKRGGKWTFDEIKRYAGNYGITGEQQIIDFYVAVNMMYSDYCKVAKKYGLDKGVEFYAEMAKAFLHDTDAVKDKLAAYRQCIAKKE